VAKSAATRPGGRTHPVVSSSHFKLGMEKPKEIIRFIGTYNMVAARSCASVATKIK
jgi:hypothetical protein